MADRDPRKGRFPGYHVLNRCDLPGHQLDFVLLDLRRVFTPRGHPGIPIIEPSDDSASVIEPRVIGWPWRMAVFVRGLR
jgi:hypothetical protein